MEVLLNSIWIAIVIAAFACALPRLRTRRALTIAIALGCALALLFPIISISDDLVIDRDALEEGTSMRRASGATHHHDTPVLAATIIVMLIVLVAIGSVATNDVPSFAAASRIALPARAPPRR
jgi:hypothetical protein